MKILRVIPSMNPVNGGPCQGLRNLIPQLQKLGIENEVVCFDNPDAEYLGKDPFVIHTLGVAEGSYSYNKNLGPWLQQNFGRFDAVIIHGLWLYNSYGTYRAWSNYKKINETFPKLYVMPHGMLDPYFQKAKGRRLKAIRNSVFYALFERKVISNADGLLFTCQQELLLAREPFKPYRPKAEFNVGYGIQPPPRHSSDMDAKFFEKFPHLKGKPFLLFLSRVHVKKGVDLLIDAYHLISQKYDMPDLVIAGPGMDTDYGIQLSKKSAGITSIHFIGMVKGDLKWGAFYNCEAFILPSHQENFGIAIVEAMACSKAVLITDKVNIWREIEESAGGYVENDDFDGVKKLLTQWHELPQDQKLIMGKNAFDIYRKNFSVEFTSQMLKETLESQN